ncbi:MAG: NAD(P)-dependent oxidoreductase [Spirochaetaceae bacterium]|nr:MAG: NAD(P)-dependent oxidoreductase [Spirochaetaceae bacterium]
MIGLIGLGAMGSGLAATLLRGGYELTVFDLDAARLKAAVDAGAISASSASELAANCDVVFTSLPSSRVTVNVIETEIAPSVKPGATVVDLGTTLLDETRRLHKLLKSREVGFLDAPVSGGEGGAATGTLFIFVGGDRAVADRTWKVLGVLGGSRLTYCGESGAGQITKAVNQLAMGLVDAAFIEAVAFGVAGGVDAETLQQAVGGDGGFRKQFHDIAGRIADGKGDGMDVKYAEYQYFLDDAKVTGFTAPILTNLHAFMKRYPDVGRDNMNRPYPPLWSALTGASKPTADTTEDTK